MNGAPVSRGFTLIELMVALTIFSLIAVAGVSLLSFSVDAQAAVSRKLDALGGIERAGALMTADLAQAVPRLTRDDKGDREPAFVGNEQGDLFRFVRAGWSNSEDAPRPTLQKIAYRLDGDRFERIVYPLLDGAKPAAPVVLFDQVTAATVRFRTEKEWRNLWDATRADSMPVALELTITRRDGDAIVQQFLVGGR